MSEALKKIRDGQSRSAPVGAVPPDSAWSLDHPLIAALLTEVEFNAKPCKSGSLIVVAEDGVWKGIINDREGGRCAFVSAPSFEELIERVEMSLGDGSLDWRYARANGLQRGNGRTR